MAVASFTPGDRVFVTPSDAPSYTGTVTGHAQLAGLRGQWFWIRADSVYRDRFERASLMIHMTDPGRRVPGTSRTI